MPKLSGLRRLLLPCGVLLIFTSHSLWGQLQVGNIIGQVRVARGAAPAEPVMITLASRGAIVNTVYTDGEGRYGFYGMAPNLYHLVVNDEKYQPLQVETKLVPAVTPLNIVNLILYPVGAVDPAPGAIPQPPASGGNPYLVDVGDYSRDFPKKAVEEFQKALKAEQRGKHEEALRGYRKAIQLAPNFYPAHNQLGVAFLARQDFAAARVEFEEVIRLNQADANAYFNLGNVFFLTNHLDDAVRLLEEGLRRQPNSGLGKFLLGSAYRRAGRLPEAERALHDAISLDPTLARAHLELVNLYVGQKRTPEAISELKLFLKAFPSDSMAPQARQVLTRLEGAPLQPVSKSQ